MNPTAVRKRLDRLQPRRGATGLPGGSLEDLTWMWWRKDHTGFEAATKGECGFLRVFATAFRNRESSDAPAR